MPSAPAPAPVPACNSASARVPGAGGSSRLWLAKRIPLRQAHGDPQQQLDAAACGGGGGVSSVIRRSTGPSAFAHKARKILFSHTKHATSERATRLCTRELAAGGRRHRLASKWYFEEASAVGRASTVSPGGSDRDSADWSEVMFRSPMRRYSSVGAPAPTPAPAPEAAPVPVLAPVPERREENSEVLLRGSGNSEEAASTPGGADLVVAVRLLWKNEEAPAALPPATLLPLGDSARACWEALIVPIPLSSPAPS